MKSIEEITEMLKELTKTDVEIDELVYKNKNTLLQKLLKYLTIPDGFRTHRMIDGNQCFLERSFDHKKYRMLVLDRSDCKKKWYDITKDEYKNLYIEKLVYLFNSCDGYMFNLKHGYDYSDIFNLKISFYLSEMDINLKNNIQIDLGTFELDLSVSYEYIKKELYAIAESILLEESMGYLSDAKIKKTKQL